MTHEYGQVASKYSLVRCVLFPIYATDQLLTMVLCAFAPLLVYFWSGWNDAVAVPSALGAYIGIIIAMWRSTPCSLLLPADKETAVVALLDNSRLIRRTPRHNEWMSVRGRLRRWDTDTIRVTPGPSGLLITGRRYDLTIIANTALGMRIKIVRRPIGEAPEWVRDAWIGVTFPTAQDSAKNWKGFGVLSMPSSALLRVWKMVTGRTTRVTGFIVNAQTAVDLLAVTRPAAAEWWRNNAPELLDGKQRLVFDAEACEVLEGPQLTGV